MSLENMKFIVKEIDALGNITYWKKYPIINVANIDAAQVFTWGTLTEDDKFTLEAGKDRLRIIPVGGLNATH